MSKYTPEYGPVDLQAIFEQVDLGPIPNQNDLVENFMPAMFELMTDGEIIVARTFEEGRLTSQERHGDYYTKLQDLWARAIADPNDPETKQMQRLGRFTGGLAAEMYIHGQLPLPDSSNIKTISTPAGDSLVIAGGKLEIPLHESNEKSIAILDLGAGLAGKSFVNWNIQHLGAYVARQRAIPSHYYPIDRGPMQVQFLTTYASHLSNALLGQGAGSTVVGRYLIGREDGITSALEEISNTDGAAKSMAAVICNALGTMNGRELAEAVKGVPRLLDEKGVMEIGLPVEPVVEGGATFDEVAQSAIDAGLTIISETTINTGNQFLGRDTVSRFAFLSHAN